ncbi:MAG TPA: hypothetical protein VF779_17675 [Pyrinomonadaceae bacterium]
MIDETGLAKFPDIAKMLDLFNSQTSTVNTLWNIFIGVNLAILGLIYKDIHLGDDWKIKLGFTAGFLFFAFANRMAILKSQRILFAICEFFHNLKFDDTSQARPILLAHRATSPQKMRNWHLAFTIMVALIIWVPEIQRLLQRT